jgi:RNA polymerase sigma factor (sigma-70 family)
MINPPVAQDPVGGQDPRDILSANLDAIRRIVRAVGRKRRLSDSDIEELESSVWLRLVEHDYRAIRQYKGRASFRTFLTVVVTRLALDVHAASWGRWRPSSRARRLGKTGMLFETLVFRDGCSREEALSVLQSTGHGDPPAAVRALAGKRRSMPRRYIPIDLVAHTLPTADQPASAIETRERRVRGRRVGRALHEAVRRMPARDRLLLRMRYEEGLKVADVARALGEDPKTLYRTLETLHRRLRRMVSERGVTSSDVGELVGRDDVYVTAPAAASIAAA